MILLFNGCSHTEGSNVPRYQTWANMVSKTISRSSCFLHICYQGEGQTVYNYLNDVDLDFFGNDLSISIAKSGKGNDAICFETIEAIEYLKSVNKKPNFVFVQWTGPSRRVFQVPHLENKIDYINPYDSDDIQLLFEPLASKITTSFMKILQDYLKLNSIEYVFLPYTEFEKNKEYENTYTYKSLDFDNILFSKSGFSKFRIDLLKQNLTNDSAGHPSCLGNWVISNKIIDKLNLNPIGFFDFFKISCYKTKVKKFEPNIRVEYVQNTEYCDWCVSEINNGFKNRNLLKGYKEKKIH